MQRRDCGVVCSKMSLIHLLPSKGRDHYRGEVRQIEEPEAAEGKQDLPGKARPLHYRFRLSLQAQDIHKVQPAKTPARLGEELMKPHPGHLEC